MKEMQGSDTNIINAQRKQDAMLVVFDEASKIVAEMCDVKKDDISSKSKIMPLPICRGICWYAIRVAFDVTYVELSKLTELMGCHYTSAGISSSVGQAINLSIRSPHWSKVWNRIKSILPNDVIKDEKDKTIVIQIIIPKGSKDNIKFEIKEQQNK